MVTTTDNINESKPTSGTKAGGVNKDDAKAMLADYNGGTSVASLATEYGYSEAEVESTVVKPVKGDA